MSQLITLEQAVEMTTRFRDEKEGILDTEYQNENILANSETFQRGVIDQVLEQSGCTGLRVYYGMDEELRVHAILVGVNSSNADILTLMENDQPLIVEDGTRCPEDCPPTSDLNP